MSKKIRLDVLLTEKGLCESRQKAQATIMAGLVFVDGQRSDKPGTPVAEDAAVEVRGHALRYVSRGGLKLEKAMQTFPITLSGKTCADIGASTGGFTDCMLQNGAAKVYAAIPVWCAWSAPTPGISHTSRSRRSWTSRPSM